MQIQRHADGWAITAPSKVNLHLEVLGRRPDGYHELCTVMTAISLCDQLVFRPREDGEIQLSVFVPPNAVEQGMELAANVSPATNLAWRIPQDSSNLVCRALNILRHALGSPMGMDVWLWKSIPAASGLGGGSSNAAAALVAGMIAWTGSYDVDLVSRLAAELGSDVNFFLEAERENGWVALCQGRGERVQPIKCSTSIELVIAHPPEGCSTAQVFRRLLPKVEVQSPAAVVSAIESGDVKELGKYLYNCLEEPARLVTPWIERLRQVFSMELHLGSAMTGSGSACFAICDSGRAAQRLAIKIEGKVPAGVFQARSWRMPAIEKQLRALGIRA